MSSMFETKLGKYYLGDARELIKEVPSESIDIVITDPPYGLGMDEYDDGDLILELEEELWRVLKPDSFLIFFFSIRNLSNVFKLKMFKYVWLIPAIELSIQKGSYSSVGFSQYVAVLVFAKGKPKPVVMSPDFIIAVEQLPILPKEDVKNLRSKRALRMFKNTSTVATLLRRFTRQGDLVLDPFAGYGSIPLVCETFNRRWLAFEIDQNKYEFAKSLILNKRTPQPTSLF